MKVDRQKINAFLSEKTGMWAGQQWKERHREMSGSGGCFGISEWKIVNVPENWKVTDVKKWVDDYGVGKIEVRRLSAKTPLDFFTPDGMVKLMEWIHSKKGNVDINNSVFGWNAKVRVRDGAGAACSIKTPQEAVALAAYEAFGGES